MLLPDTTAPETAMLVPLVLALAAHADDAADVHALLQQWQHQRMLEKAPSITVEQVRQALSGERVKGIQVIEGVAAALGYGLTTYDLPVADVWRAVADENHHEAYLPVNNSLVVQGRAGADDHLIYQFMELPLVSDRWWVTRIRYNRALHTATNGQAWELAFSDVLGDAATLAGLDQSLLAEGIPLAWTRGAWLFVSLGASRTLTQYVVWSDPGGSLPTAAASRFSAGAVVSTLDSVEKMAREHIPRCSSSFWGPGGEKL